MGLDSDKTLFRLGLKLWGADLDLDALKTTVRKLDPTMSEA